MQPVACILHTGSSWHGSIGRSEINVTFIGREFVRGLLLMPLREVAKGAFANDLRVKSITPNAVV